MPLTQLDKTSEEAKWFISKVGTLKKPTGKEYDYQQLNRLLSIKTLFDLDSSQIVTSKYLADLKREVSGDLIPLLLAIHFQEAYEGEKSY